MRGSLSRRRYADRTKTHNDSGSILSGTPEHVRTRPGDAAQAVLRGLVGEAVDAARRGAGHQRRAVQILRGVGRATQIVGGFIIEPARSEAFRASRLAIRPDAGEHDA